MVLRGRMVTDDDLARVAIHPGTVDRR